MTLKNYYEDLGKENPQAELRNKIIKACGISKKTFYRWINGDTENIKPLFKEKIAEIIDTPVENLFPKLKNEEHYENV
ncbi:MAG: hypothetical protein JEY96_01710 [Bacteroidales bacterium]|nr:hypothetical protein [Bacteroidales bacterium]